MTINTHNILAVAAMIEESAEARFEMAQYGKPIQGMKRDIAGWVAVWAGMKQAPSLSTAGHVLGLDRKASEDIFSPESRNADYLAEFLTADKWGLNPAFISKERAVRQLRNLASTGQVDWTATP